MEKIFFDIVEYNVLIERRKIIKNYYEKVNLIKRIKKLENRIKVKLNILKIIINDF